MKQLLTLILLTATVLSQTTKTQGGFVIKETRGGDGSGRTVILGNGVEVEVGSAGVVEPVGGCVCDASLTRTETQPDKKKAALVVLGASGLLVGLALLSRDETKRVTVTTETPDVPGVPIEPPVKPPVTPVPEPAPIALIAIGLTGLFLVLRKKQDEK